MTYRIAICYGRPADPAAFDAYYAETHVPLARKIPGLSAFTWGNCSPLGSEEPPYYMVANLQFPTADALERALTSTEMKAAGRDVRNFATGGVTMFTQSEQSGLIP
ncbi:EthD family reductase [Nocardia sp. NPDC046763]|uniref:EthD family reductase n=1 Tax=Nocardia sp. NPDC046763 TaxID=3155256 RepID=UPI0033EDB61F